MVTKASLEVDAIVQSERGFADVLVRFNYTSNHPMEVAIYVIDKQSGYAVFWRCHRSVLRAGLYQEEYPHEGDLRTRTDVSEDLSVYTYFISMRTPEAICSVGIKDHIAMEEYIYRLYEEVPESEEVPGVGWESALERLLRVEQ